MTTLSDLPNEILHHVLSQFAPSEILGSDLFWSRGISPKTLLPPSKDSKEHKELRREQIQVAKCLCLVSRRMKAIFVPMIWLCFECRSLVALENLSNACAGQGELGGYIQYLDLRLRFTDSPISLDNLCPQLEAIWLCLTSLRSLTLSLTSTHPCSASLATQLQSIPTLKTLRLCIFGASLGPHLRIPSQLRELFIEIHPPDIDGRVSIFSLPEGGVEVPGEVYHDWKELFNDVVGLVEASTASGNLETMTWFVHWTLVHSFYKHMKRVVLPSPSSSQPPPPSLLPTIKHLDPSELHTLSRLSLTLDSQMGTRAFLDAVRGLPLTDLALTAYDLSLLSGTVFRELCEAFGGLQRLRIKLRMPSITVGEEVESVNEDEFIRGLASLKCLEAYRGPVLFQRQKSVEAHQSVGFEIKTSLARLSSSLRARGTIDPGALFQWHVWLDGVYGPKEYMTVPDNGPAVLGHEVFW